MESKAVFFFPLFLPKVIEDFNHHRDIYIHPVREKVTVPGPIICGSPRTQTTQTANQTEALVSSGGVVQRFQGLRDAYRLQFRFHHLALAHADRSLCLYRWKVGVEEMGLFLILLNLSSVVVIAIVEVVVVVLCWCFLTRS